MEKEIALVEAVLYLECGFIEERKIAEILGLEEETVKTAIQKLNEKYSSEAGAFEITNNTGGSSGSASVGVKLSIKQTILNNQDIKDRYGKKNEAKISRAAMETLAIIAYSQPVTRAEIEKIRGVSADNMIRLLMEKGLIKEAGKKETPGRPVMYGTTREFLTIFGLNSIAELPKLSEVDVEKFELTGE